MVEVVVAAGALLSSLAAPVFTAGVFKSVVMSLVVSGVQAGVAALTRKKRAAALPINDPGVNQTVRDGVAKQRLIYGYALVGGVVFFQESQPPYIHIGYLIASGENTGLEQVRVGTIRVPLDSDGYATSTPYNDGVTKFLRFSYGNGSDSQTIDTILDTDYPALPATFRQRGITRVVMKAHYGGTRDNHEKLYTNSFSPLFLIKGRKIYDPRIPTCISNDASTWVFSNNPTLCICDYLRHEKGGQYKFEDFDWSQIITNADKDDEYVNLKAGGTERRYSLDGMIILDAEIQQIIQTMLTANRGILVWSNGKMQIWSGVSREPEVTISRENMVGGFEFRNDKPTRELLNTIRTEFVAEDREYAVNNGPVYLNTALKDQDGEEHTTTLRLSFTSSHQTVQRIAKAHCLESRLRKALKIAVDLTHFKITAGTIVRFDFDVLPTASGIYMVLSTTMSNGFGAIELTMVEYDKTIYDWLPSVDEEDFTLTVTSAT